MNAQAPRPHLLHAACLDHARVPHAFTTRVGGVSTGVFDSLNFGNPGDLPAEHRDPPDRIARNIELVLSEMGLMGREVVQVHQVHQDTVLVVRPGLPAHRGERDTHADAIVSNDPSRVLMIRTADCAPVLLSSGDGRVVGAAHAGWRGVVTPVVPACVRAMQALGATDIVAAIGPCIGGEALEVGPEVLGAFAGVFGNDPAIIRPYMDDSGKGTVDLAAALARQLRESGVGVIEPLGRCTVREPELFFSHRRERGVTGRLAAFIAPRG